MADEVVPAAASFGPAAGDVADFPVSRAGNMLWLYQHNAANKDGETGKQAEIISVDAAAAP